MPKGRLEAFSDGVIAILITIMVLDLPVPRGSGFHALRPLVPVFFTYLLSFVNLRGEISPLLCLAGIPLAFAERWVSLALYVVVAGMWLIPDRRVENRIVQSDRA